MLYENFMVILQATTYLRRFLRNLLSHEHLSNGRLFLCLTLKKNLQSVKTKITALALSIILNSDEIGNFAHSQDETIWVKSHLVLLLVEVIQFKIFLLFSN